MHIVIVVVVVVVVVVVGNIVVVGKIDTDILVSRRKTRQDEAINTNQMQRSHTKTQKPPK